MQLEQAERKTNDRNVGYGVIGECTITPLDNGRYYVDLADDEGRWYRSIISKVYIGWENPLKAKREVRIEGMEFKINHSELHLRPQR